MLWLVEQIDLLRFAEVSSFLPRLSELRQQTVLRAKHEPTRVQSVLAELLLRYALVREYGLFELPRIERGKQGKPYFPTCPELRFNLSHCKNAVACALDAAPVGVDVQELQPPHSRSHWQSDRLLDHVTSELERAWILAAQTPTERDRRFLAVWTCKEAYGKAIGEGILYDLKQTAFLPREGTWRQYDRCFQHTARPDAMLTLCCRAPLGLQIVLPADLLRNEVYE